MCPPSPLPLCTSIPVDALPWFVRAPLLPMSYCHCAGLCARFQYQAPPCIAQCAEQESGNKEKEVEGRGCDGTFGPLREGEVDADLNVRVLQLADAGTDGGAEGG
jgi:hypothetical protein